MANNSIFTSNPKFYEMLSLINVSIQIDAHEHPLIFCFTPDRQNYGNSWACNKCFCNYKYQLPSFYCTFCDYDLCSNCLGIYKLNNINIYRNYKQNSLIQNNPDLVFKWQKQFPSHTHLLTLIKKINISWNCDKCLQSFKSDTQSYYCSLCDFDICENCMNNSNNNNNNKMKNNNLIIPISNIQDNQNNIFQIKSFQTLNEEYTNKNLLYCPLPLQLLFTLLANGIKPGNALDELTNCFLIQDLNEENNYYIQLLTSLFNYSSLNMANTIFCRFTPQSQFQLWLQRYLTTMSKSKDELNAFIYDKTKHKIANYFNDNDLLDDMILTNVLYFKGFWKKKFEPCFEDIFYNSKGERNTLKMMKCKDDFKYYKDNYIEVIELPYKDDNMSALIILPDKSILIDNLINKMNGLTQEKLNIIYNKLQKRKVEIKMPKFKFNGVDRINLKQMIKKMGINEIFEFSDTNFIPLVGDNSFRIEKIFQTNLLNVDEIGTELISITTITGLLGCVKPYDETIYMTVDRPFLFIIRNEKFQIGKDIILIAKIEDIKNQ